MACDPGFRSALAAKGYTLDPDTGEVTQLVPYAGEFSARAAQITRNVDRYEAAWRAEHPGEEPGRRLRRSWDRRAWAQARPDKAVPRDGEQLEQRWVDDLIELGFSPPTGARIPAPVQVGTAAYTLPLGVPIAGLDRDAAAELVLVRLGGRRSAWNAADIRGEVEKIIATHGVIATTAVRVELAEDVVARAVARCVPLLPGRTDVPTHVRSLTSGAVLDVEAALMVRLVSYARMPTAKPYDYTDWVDNHMPPSAQHLCRDLDPAQKKVVAAAHINYLTVVEGAAGTGKTTILTAVRVLVEQDLNRLVVVTPTLKAAQVAGEQVGAAAFSAAWLIHQHGYRWDTDGHVTRLADRTPTDPRALLDMGDLVWIDEAGMLDQDTALALMTIAAETHARVAFAGDRHQLPAVGRGGVMDHATRWADPGAVLSLDTIHRFTDPAYADLSLLMRTGERPGEVFDALHARGSIKIYPTQVEQHAALTALGTPASPGTIGAPGAPGASGEWRVIAQTREHVAQLNAAIRDHRLTTTGGDPPTPTTSPTLRRSARLTARLTAALTPGPADVAGGRSADVTGWVTTSAGEQIGVGDRVATRRNNRYLEVANRDTWTVTALHPDGGLEVEGRNGHRDLPAEYVELAVELAYATTVHGAQGETVDHAHLLVGESTGAAAAYVAMTRGRRNNTAHLVADNIEDARAQWVQVFSRDRADLGPEHAAQTALDDIDTYGPQPPTRPTVQPDVRPARQAESWRTQERHRSYGRSGSSRGPSR